MNTLPKYVVSTTIREAEWNPTTVLRGDPTETVSELKARPGRELQIHGSARLANTLLSAGLVDTIRLVIAPTMLGSGRRLLSDPGPATGLRLVHQEATKAGLLMVEYEAHGDAPLAEYDGVTAFTRQE
jgi:dihydrofolate reductase